MTSDEIDFHPDAHPEATQIEGDANYGKWGQCISPNSDDDRCGGHAKGPHGKCHFHGGSTPTAEENPRQGRGDQEGNQNAQTHSLYSTPEYLKDHLEPHHEEAYVAMYESLCARYEDVHAQEPDYFAKKRLSRVCIETVKEDLVDEWLAENADESGNLLIEHVEFEQDGREVSFDRPNQIIESMTALKRETRLTLKDMGLLRDPDTRQAEATGTLAASIKKAVSDHRARSSS